jgi:hypothetical protein
VPAGGARGAHTSPVFKRDWALDDGRAFVVSYGHPLRNRRHPQHSATYAPEGMEPRSGVHDGKGARRGTLVKGRT